jgi:TP901 family phage tail tape measure protein
MANNFNIVATLNIQAGNLSALQQQLQRTLGSIRGTIDLKIDPNSIKGTQNLDQGLRSLNQTLATVQQNIKNTASAFNALAGSIKNLQGGFSVVQNGLQGTSKIAVVMAQSFRQGSEGLELFGNTIGVTVRRMAAFATVSAPFFLLKTAITDGIGQALVFDRQMVRLAQVSGDTATEIGAIRTEITRLSTSFGVSSKELADVAVTFKQAGLSARETKVALEALALSALAPNFDSMAATAEGAIAVMRQFKVDAGSLKETLGSMNAVAGAFAVESKDLIEATKRLGGAFSQTGGSLNEMLALFTAVRSTTRESAEQIATGLRTIFTRVQRNRTVEALKEVGIQLRTTASEAKAAGDLGLQGRFVGAFEAVRRLSEGLSRLNSNDPRYAQIIEELGGYRQISRVIPLVREFAEAQKALNVAQAGGVSLSIAAEKAQGSLLVQVEKTKQEFLAMFRAIADDKAFKGLVQSVLSLARGIAQLGTVLSSALPALLTLGGLSVGRAIFSSGAGILKGIRGYAKGGSVEPSDTVPAMLTPGEYIFSREAVRNVGVRNLDEFHKKARGFAQGGPVGYARGGRVETVSLSQVPITLDEANIVGKNLEKFNQTLQLAIANMGLVNREIQAQIQIGKRTASLVGFVSETGEPIPLSSAQTAAPNLKNLQQKVLSGVPEKQKRTRAKEPLSEDVVREDLVQATIALLTEAYGVPPNKLPKKQAYEEGTLREKEVSAATRKQVEDAKRRFVQQQEDQKSIQGLINTPDPILQTALLRDIADKQLTRLQHQRLLKLPKENFRAQAAGPQFTSFGQAIPANVQEFQFTAQPDFNLYRIPEDFRTKSSRRGREKLLYPYPPALSNYSQELGPDAFLQYITSVGKNKQLYNYPQPLAQHDYGRELFPGALAFNITNPQGPFPLGANQFTQQFPGTGFAFHNISPAAQSLRSLQSVRGVNKNLNPSTLPPLSRAGLDLGPGGLQRLEDLKKLLEQSSSVNLSAYEGLAGYTNESLGQTIDLILRSYSQRRQQGSLVDPLQERAQQRAAGVPLRNIIGVEHYIPPPFTGLSGLGNPSSNNFGPTSEGFIVASLLRDAGVRRGISQNPAIARNLANFIPTVPDQGEAVNLGREYFDTVAGATRSRKVNSFTELKTFVEGIKKSGIPKDQASKSVEDALFSFFQNQSFNRNIIGKNSGQFAGDLRSLIDDAGLSKSSRAVVNQGLESFVGYAGGDKFLQNFKQGGAAKGYLEKLLSKLFPGADTSEILDQVSRRANEVSGPNQFTRLVQKSTGERLRSQFGSTQIHSSTSQKVYDQEQERLQKEFINTQKRVIQARYRELSDVDALAIATDQLKEAMQEGGKSLRFTNGKFIGLAGDVEFLRDKRGIDPSKLPSQGKFGIPNIDETKIGSKIAQFANIAAFALPALGGLVYAGSGSAKGVVEGTVSQGRFFGGRGLGGALTGAGAGAFLGASLGPTLGLGVASGALTFGIGAAVAGIVASLVSAADDIKQVKIDKSVGDFSIAISQLATAGKAASLTVRENLTKSIAAASASIDDKARSESTKILGVIPTFGLYSDPSARVNNRRQLLRDSFGGQLPEITQVLGERATQLGRRGRERTLEDLTKEFSENDTNKRLLGISAGIRQVPIKELLDQFQKNIRAGQDTGRIDENRLRNLAEQNQAIVSFRRLVVALESATDATSKFRTRFDSINSLLEGSITPSSISLGLERLSQPDRPDSFAPLQGIVGSLGNSPFAQQYSGRIVGLGQALNQFSQVLPSILQDLVATRDTAQNDIATRLDIALRDRFRGQITPELGQVFSQAVGFFENQFSGEEGARKFSENLRVNPDQVIQETIAKAGGDLLRKLGEDLGGRLEKNANAFIESLGKINIHLQRLGEIADRTAGLQVQAGRTQIEFGLERSGYRRSALDVTPLSLLTFDFDSRQRRLGGAIGQNPRALGAEYDRLGQTILQAEARRNDIGQRQGTNTEAFRNAAKALSDLQIRANNTKQALEGLANAANLAAAREKLRNIQDEKQSRLGFAERLATAGPDELADLIRATNLTKFALGNGGQNFQGLLAEDRKLVLDFLKSAGTAKLPGFQQPGGPIPRAADLVENLLGGIIPQLPEDKREEEGLRRFIEAGTARAVEANRELERIQAAGIEALKINLESQQRTFLQNLDQLFRQYFGTDRNTQLTSRKAELSGLTSKVNLSNLGAVGITNDDQFKALSKRSEDLAKLQSALRDRTSLQERFDSLREVGESVRTGNITSLPELKKRLERTKLSDDDQALITGQLDSIFFRNVLGNRPDLAFKRFQSVTSDTILGPNNQNVNILDKEIGERRKNLGTIQGLRPEDINERNIGGIINTINSLNELNLSFDGFTAKVKELTGVINGLQRGQVNRAGGGSIFQPRGTDTVPAMLTPGEYVVNASSAQANLPLLETINKKKGPVYAADGGFFDPNDPLTKEFLQRQGNVFVNKIPEKPVAKNQRIGIGDIPIGVPFGTFRKPDPTPAQIQGNLLAAEVAFQAASNPFGLTGQTVNQIRSDRLIKIQQERRDARARAQYRKDLNLLLSPERGGFVVGRGGEQIVNPNADRRVEQDNFDRIRAGKRTLAYERYQQKVASFGGQEKYNLGQRGERLAINSYLFNQAGQISQAARASRQASLPDRGVGKLAVNQTELLRQRNAQNARFLDYRGRRQVGYGANYFVRPQRFEDGGVVTGPSGIDVVPSLLTEGEFVLNRNAVAKAGLHNLKRFNQGGLVGYYQEGGQVQQGNVSLNIPQQFQQALTNFTNSLGNFAGTFTSFENSLGNLSQAFGVFTGTANTLAEALNNMPRNVQFEGNVNHNHNFNGIEALTQMEPTFRNMVTEMINEKLRTVFKTQLPDAGVQI